LITKILIFIILFTFITTPSSEAGCRELIDNLIGKYFKQTLETSEPVVEIKFALRGDIKWPSPKSRTGKPNSAKGRVDRLYTTGHGRMIDLDPPSNFIFNVPKKFKLKDLDLSQHKIPSVAKANATDYNDSRLLKLVGEAIHDPRIHAVKIGEGGLNKAYVVHSNACPSNFINNDALHKEWALKHGENIQVVRILIPRDELASMLKREYSLMQLAEQSAPHAKLDGKPFIRTVKDFSTPDELALGITRKEFIEGPSASLIQFHIDTLKAQPNNAKSLEFINTLGLKDAHEARLYIRGLESYFKQMDSTAINLSLERKLSLMRNTSDNQDINGTLKKIGFDEHTMAKDLDTHATGVPVETVGIDYNHGSNVIWSIKDKMWIIVDF